MRQLIVVGAPMSGSFLLEYGVFAAAAQLMGWIGTRALDRASDRAADRRDHVHGAVRHRHGGNRTRRPCGRAGRCGCDAARGLLGARARHRVHGGDDAAGRGRRATCSRCSSSGAMRPTPRRSRLRPRCWCSARRFFIADGMQTVAAGALRGLNDTRVPLIFAAISFWLVGFVGCWVFGFTLGLRRLRHLDRPVDRHCDLRGAAGLALPSAHRAALSSGDREHRAVMTERLDYRAARPSRRRCRGYDRRAGVRALCAARRNGRGRVGSPAIPIAGICCASRRRARSASRRSVRISAIAADARCSIGTSTRYRAWKRDILVQALRRRAARGAGRRTDRRARRRAGDAPSCMRGAADAIFSRSASRPARAASRSSGSTVARCWRRQWTARSRLPGRSPRRSSPLKKPLDIQVTATDAGLDVDVRGSGSLQAQSTASLARIAEAHKLARITRHGELITQRVAADVANRQRAIVALPPARSCRRRPPGEAALVRLVLGHVGDAKASGRSLLRRRAVRAASRRDRARARASTPMRRRSRRWRRRPRTSGLKPIEAEARDLFRRPLCPMSSSASTRSCSTRRARAPRRRRASLRPRRCRWSSRSRATPRPSRAMRASWSTAAIGLTQ